MALTAKLEIRTSQDDKRRIKRAALLSGKDMSELYLPAIMRLVGRIEKQAVRQSMGESK